MANVTVSMIDGTKGAMVMDLANKRTTTNSIMVAVSMLTTGRINRGTQASVRAMPSNASGTLTSSTADRSSRSPSTDARANASKPVAPTSYPWGFSDCASSSTYATNLDVAAWPFDASYEMTNCAASCPTKFAARYVRLRSANKQ